MNFLTLEYFLAVADELNITKAAERLYISQQSLSNSIIKLEKTLGAKLFNRTPNFSLTFAGQKLVEAARSILDSKSRVLSEISDISLGRKGLLRIGISHTRGLIILPDLLPSFKLSHPHIEVQIVEGNSDVLEGKLEDGEIDLIFSFLPIMLECVKSIELVREKLFLVVPRKFTDQIFLDKSDFYRGKFSLSGDLLPFKDCPILILKEGNRIRGVMDFYFASLGITPTIALEIDNIETAFALAVKGMGITVYPEMFLNKVSKDTQELVDLFPLNSLDTTCTLAIGYNVKRYLSKPAQDFIQLALSTLSTSSSPI